MTKWANFSIWRGRLPHWRADNVTYYVTFKHRRALNEDEMSLLLRRVMGTEGRKFEHAVICVLPEATELMFTVCDNHNGDKYELSDVIEKAKAKAGKEIIKKSGEKWPPFYHESYDRIVRDDAEFEETFLKIVESPTQSGCCDPDHEWPNLFVPEPANNPRGPTRAD